MEEKISRIGYINLSGKTVISDPCYSRGTWCMVTDVAVMPGRYAVYLVTRKTGVHGIRVMALLAIHTGHHTSHQTFRRLNNCGIGVDSGQCGIFDDAVYPAEGDCLGEYGDKDSFYGECCELTCGDALGGILKMHNGVVSSSGYGDGEYELYCRYDQGERVALLVNFGLQCASKDALLLDGDGFSPDNK